MHDERDKAEQRIDRFLDERVASATVTDLRQLSVAMWPAPGEPVEFAVATANDFESIEPGARWGVAWGTTWFAVTGEVPSGWPSDDSRYRIELSLDLGFNPAKPGFQCEGLVWDESGALIKGLEPRNYHVPIDAAPGESFTVFVEAASNPDLSGGDDFKGPTAFAPTPYGDRSTAPTQPLYRLGRFDLRLIDTEVETFGLELRVLRGLMSEQRDAEPRRSSILVALTRALDSLDPDDIPSTVGDARLALAPALAAPASHSAHRIVATGHAHIDSAWLWPTRETVRKCARTFSNVLALMDDDPDLNFTCSSAQHFAWMKQFYPELFERIKTRVAEGRLVPVGNMWVESDVNMPNGESVVRQLLRGSRFFESEFGQISEVGWLPDSFGYPGALPQLLRKAGLRWFFTQKMSWSETNTMPHHSFEWEGIDGSRIFTHFPPTNTYSGDMRPLELARSVRNFSDHGRASVSLMPFGYGDGGGGPTREMMTMGRLQADLEGSPRVRFDTAREFFIEAQDEYSDPPVWSGEMYLEFHRGVFTSQARTKRGNRLGERLLAEAELWAATASIRCGAEYPYDEFESLWRELLLLQFHDILPGTAIAWVHREAEARHAAIADRLEKLIADRLDLLAGPGRDAFAVNSAPVAVRGIPARSGTVVADRERTRGTAEKGAIILESARLRVTITTNGLISSIIDVESGRELIPRGRFANLPQLHNDIPNKWDAWDLDASYRNTVTNLETGTAELTESPTESHVTVTRAFGSSTITQRISLDAAAPTITIRSNIAWHERQKLLKLSFPLDVHADHSSSETQFGHVRRSVHTNTSWDASRYEFCAHRWLHVGEAGFGVAVANDSLYGHDVAREVDDGRVTTNVRQSLLRAPTFPDPDADQGDHEILTTVTVARTIGDAVRAGYAANFPAREVLGQRPIEPIIEVVGSAVLAEAVKLAEDRSGDVIVRLYESEGSRAEAEVRVGFPFESVREVDLLERDLESEERTTVTSRSSDSVTVKLRPFEVVTLRINRPEVAQQTS